jgi:1,4-dihydroxy-2-naphthoate octaprenyltransferase
MSTGPVSHLRFSALYRGIHYLSFDIVAGALASSCFASALFNAAPAWSWWITLAMTVWILYTGGHVLDAWKHRKNPYRGLHRFIFRNRRNLLWFMGVVAVADLLLVFNLLDAAYLKYGMLLAGLVLLFYAFRHLFKRNSIWFVPGELFVLLLFMAGTWLGPYVSRAEPIDSTHLLIAVMFVLVLLMNLGIISLYDIHIDTRLGIVTLAQSLGQKATRNLLIGAGLAVYLLSILQLMVFGMDRLFRFPLILSAMATLLMMVLLMPSYFRKNDYYRWAADAVLYLGFLALLE